VEGIHALNPELTGLVKGEHILKLLITGGYVNLDYIQFGDKTTAISVLKPFDAGSGMYKVFDLRGEYVGTVNLSAGFTAADVARQVKLKKGVYLVKNAGGLSKRLIYSE
jgi:hypothetical protein